MSIVLEPVEIPAEPVEVAEPVEAPEPAEPAAPLEAPEPVEPAAPLELAEPAPPQSALPAPKKRGRPPKVQAVPAAPKAKASAPKAKARAPRAKPAPPPDSDSSDVDDTLRNVYNHVAKPDMETAILQFLVNRRQSESTRRRELWGRLAQM